mgnify:FL=1
MVAADDLIRIDTENGTETTLDAIKTAADVRWVNTANVDTGTDTNDATVSDTVIYNTAGTTVTTDDYAVMVLEDYTTPLTVNDFDVV